MGRHWRAFILLSGLAGLVFAGAARWRSAAETLPPEPFQGKPENAAGRLLIDATTRQPAVGALTVDFVRSPNSAGRYLVAVNSGYGLKFNAGGKNLQSLAVIDLQAAPEPQVIQNVYFPQPQSANVGAVFAPQPDADGAYTLYVAGGVENKIWLFHFTPNIRQPLAPASGSDPDAPVKAPFIDVSVWGAAKTDPRYNEGLPPVYPTGLAIAPDGNTLFVANNLDDSLGLIEDLRGGRKLRRIALAGGNKQQTVYPYSVAVWPAKDGRNVEKIYISAWNEAQVIVVKGGEQARVSKGIPVGQHPTAMLWNRAKTRLYVANSNDDSVSVIDPATDSEIERISTKLNEKDPIGNSPEGLALSADEKTLYVANAHSGTLAVVSLAETESGRVGEREQKTLTRSPVRPLSHSRIAGFIPTGRYPSAVAVAGKHLFIANGKGTGFANSSVVANDTGMAPNAPNDRFPSGTGRGGGAGGEYSISLLSGTISLLNLPTERELAAFTQTSLRKNGLLGAKKTRLFAGASPIKHIIYIIRENRTYDQVFGDVEKAGNGQKADGDPALAIFGAGAAARVYGGPPQNVTPNARALALRFGLLDRFFVNSEASPDGHNWSTAAFSSDYVDKAYRWDYSGRGRAYDYEGFNRLPNIFPQKDTPPLWKESVSADDVMDFWQRYAPDMNGGRDVAEPQTLYLWDACARAGLSYRTYGEFVATLSQADLDSVNNNKSKPYPDLSPNISVLSTKKSLVGHYSPTFRNYDMETPDALTPESYREAKKAGGPRYPQPNGYTRLDAWLDEFNGFVADLQAGKGDKLPNFSLMHLPNDHTSGLSAGKPTPQFYVAENDYALGRIVEAVSHSPYWQDTALFVLEDDAQDGPDHIDAHRSPALVISAYNRPGALIHEYHNTVSLIRTMELLLGIAPMNFLDANATPIDIFQAKPDLRPFDATLPDVALDNLVTPRPRNAQARYWQQRTNEQDLTHPDVADAGILNQAIWFSVRGPREPMPQISRLPVFDAMRAGLPEDDETEAEED